MPVPVGLRLAVCWLSRCRCTCTDRQAASLIGAGWLLRAVTDVGSMLDAVFESRRRPSLYEERAQRYASPVTSVFSHTPSRSVRTAPNLHPAVAQLKCL